MPSTAQPSTPSPRRSDTGLRAGAGRIADEMAVLPTSGEAIEEFGRLAGR